MRIVLLALDGEAGRAASALRARYAGAEVVPLGRSDVERGGALARLSRLRALSPEAFAVSTERLAWQQGRAALMLFGALAGARRLILLDAHGGFQEERRGRVLAGAPARFAREAASDARALVRARRGLRRLERAVAGGALSARLTPAGRVESGAAGGGVSLVYLRATPAPATQSGGSTTHINGFIGAALALGARVHVVSNDPIAGLDESRVTLTVVGPEPRGLTRPLFDLRNALLFTGPASAEVGRTRPDFIYQRYSRFSWAGVEASLRTGRPLFLEYNGSEVWMGRHWDRAGLFSLLERVERLNLAAASRVFVVAEAERRNLLRAGLPAEKIVVNPNGVDVEKFRPGVGGRGERERLGVGDDEMLVGFVGTFGPWHGAEVLAEAASLVPAGARARFLFVGQGSRREAVETILRERGAYGRAVFTGAVGHERVPALLDACDVLASPHVPLAGGAEFFGSPTKLFEYMAMAKPVVASRLGQIAEVLEDGRTALLVEPGDARALADALLRLSSSPELRARLGEAARRACAERYTWTHNARRVLDAYRALAR